MSEQEFNKLFAKNLNNYLQANDKTQLDLANHLGVSTSAVSAWCRGLKTPRMDKVDAMCKYFGIKRSDLMEEKSSKIDSYYLDDEARNLAEFLYSNPEYKVLFDATRKVKKDDIQFVKELIDRMSNRN